MITGEGPLEARLERIRNAAKAAMAYWTRHAGVLMPYKKNPMLLDILILLLKSLDLRWASDLRDLLFFTLSFVCGARGIEVTNMTWGDVTILGIGEAVKIFIRPSKYSSVRGSTSTSQMRRREHPQVPCGIHNANETCGVRYRVLSELLWYVVHDLNY